MKVLNAEPYGYSIRAVECWKQHGIDYTALNWDEIVSAGIQDAHILITRLSRKVGETELKLFPELKFLISATTGLDHIDIRYIEERNIQLISLRGEDEFLKTIPSTAEHTWGLLLSLVRNIPAACESVRSGVWNRDSFRGYQLKGKTLGIIGLGRTGKKVAKYASAFEMNVTYFDPFVNDGAFTKAYTLSELLQHADIVSLHVHLTESTKYLLNKENIGLIKEGSFIINTSRGLICDEEALALAVGNKQIAGLAVDVLSTELSTITTNPLHRVMMQGGNIIITPHLGGATWDAMWACEEFILHKVLKMLK